jgi:hypothetical protein
MPALIANISPHATDLQHGAKMVVQNAERTADNVCSHNWNSLATRPLVSIGIFVMEQDTRRDC